MDPSGSTMQTHFVDINEEAPEAHPVAPPPKQSTLHRLKVWIKETFFSDDPLRLFKGQTLQRKLILGGQYLFPVLEWGPKYNLKLLKSDLISGITIASLAIPQGISYAKLANVPPILGLYSSFVPPLVYVVLGSSKDLAVGPVSISSLVMGSMLQDEVSPIEDPDLFLKLALTSTLFAGLFQAALGILSIKKPKLFWVSAGAPLVCVIISTILSFAIKAQHHGISIIGKLPKGINPPSTDKLIFNGTHLGLVIKTGFITGILSLTEGIAVGRTFAALRNYRVDGNKEMMAIGLMNMVGCTTSCYVTTGSFSRSAVNNNAGAKSAMSNAIMSLAVMVTLLFLMPLFHYTPNVILGAIIITAVIGLIDIPAAYLLWKIDKFDFLVMLVAFFGVIFISVQYGLAIAVGLSILKLLLQITRPKTVMLGNIPGTDIYRDLHHYKEAARVPGFLILRIEAPISFVNITYLHERILRWVEEVEEDSMLKDFSLQFMILEMSVLVKLRKADDGHNNIRDEYLFVTVGEAVASLSSIMKTPTVREEAQETVVEY
ncbi:unnamed protein product [Lupinus luteus]|uniref:STAS domain-containing protein n=1 Tax=Lupinus luteus TaxID=3873 RepID=A0AAV1WWN8_LUPLU